MKTKFVTIGLVQSKVSADVDANLKKTEKMIRQAAKKVRKLFVCKNFFKHRISRKSKKCVRMILQKK